MTTTSRPAVEPPAGGLSIGALSRITGVSVATLRTWEQRYDFPLPQRLPSGHRRYDHATIDAVTAVARQREAGVDLPSAIAGARAPGGADGSSVFLEVRRRHPDLPFERIHGRTLLAITRALEDECCARAYLPVLFGGFQRQSSYEPLRARWADLARTARATLVFADFHDIAVTGEPTRVPLRPGSPLVREWFVVCDGPDRAAALVAAELPGQERRPMEDREYDAVWTLEPEVVRTASRVGAAVGLAAGAMDAEGLTHHLAMPVSYLPDPVRPVLLFNRIVAYLDRSSRDGER